MDIALFWSLFVMLGITYFAIAMSASRTVESDEDFFYANRKYGIFAMSLSLSAIHIGGGMVIGSSQEAYLHGFYGIFYNLGIVLGFFILALGLSQKLRASNIKTTAQLFLQKYNSRVLMRIASLMSIMTLCGIFIAQIIASRRILDTVIGHHQWILLLFWLLVICYTMFGGLRAVVATEIFQVLFVIIVFGGVFAIYLFNHPSNIEFYKNIENLFAVDKSFIEPNIKRLATIFFMPFFYAFIAQDLGQRFFSSKTPTVASISALIAGVIILLFAAMPIIFGMEAQRYGIALSPGRSVMLDLLQKNIDPFFFYLLVCAVIAAISSTADAVLCALGSNVVEDFLMSSPYGNIDKHVGAVISRVVIFLLGIASLFVAYFLDDILAILSLSYEISISCLLIPILCGLFFKKLPVASATLAMSFGFLGFIIFRFIPTSIIPKEILSIALSSVGFIIGYFFWRFKKQKSA